MTYLGRVGDRASSGAAEDGSRTVLEEECRGSCTKACSKTAWRVAGEFTGVCR